MKFQTRSLSLEPRSLCQGWNSATRCEPRTRNRHVSVAVDAGRSDCIDNLWIVCGIQDILDELDLRSRRSTTHAEWKQVENTSACRVTHIQFIICRARTGLRTACPMKKLARFGAVENCVELRKWTSGMKHICTLSDLENFTPPPGFETAHHPVDPPGVWLCDR